LEFFILFGFTAGTVVEFFFIKPLHPFLLSGIVQNYNTSLGIS